MMRRIPTSTATTASSAATSTSDHSDCGSSRCSSTSPSPAPSSCGTTAVTSNASLPADGLSSNHQSHPRLRPDPLHRQSASEIQAVVSDQVLVTTEADHKSQLRPQVHDHDAHDDPMIQMTSNTRSPSPHRPQSSMHRQPDTGSEDGSGVRDQDPGDRDSCLSIQSYCPSLLSHESIASSSSSSSTTGNTSDSGSSSLLTTAPESLTGSKPFRSFRSSEDYLFAMKEDLADWLNQLYDLDMRVENFISTLETGVILCRHANRVIQKARELRAAGSPVPDYFLSPKVAPVPAPSGLRRGSSSGRSSVGTTASSSRSHHQSSGMTTTTMMKSSHSFSGSPAGLFTSRRSLGAIYVPSKLLQPTTGSPASTPGTDVRGGGVGAKLTVTTTTTTGTADSVTPTPPTTTMTMSTTTAGQRLALNDANQKDHSFRPGSRLTHSINDVRNESDAPNDQNPPNDLISCRTTTCTANNSSNRENGGPAFHPKSRNSLTINNNNNNHNNNNSYTISYRKNAERGTFHARDNVCNFITWCRSLQIRECLLFETEDLVLGKNEKSVILCLLEVARKGSMLGMSIPLLIQLEQEIDQEIQSDEQQLHQQELRMTEQASPPPTVVVAQSDPTPKSITRIPILSRGRDRVLDEEDEQEDVEDEDEAAPDAKRETRVVTSSVDPQHDSQYNSETDSDTSSTTFASIGPQPQIVTNDLKSLHEHVVELLNRCTCPSQYPMIKVSDGKYRIGDTKTLIFVRILRRHVMVRVGGGWDTLEHYLDKHDPCRCYYLLNGGTGGRRRSSAAGLTSAGNSFNFKNGVKV